MNYQTKKIICVGRNYVEHIEELDNEMPTDLVLFLKPTSAISERLLKPKDSCRFECELCFLIEEKKIHAIGLGLDLTLDKIQNALKSKGLPWERAKAFKESATFSQFTTDFKNINDLHFELKINGESKQIGKVELMIYHPDEILRECDEIFGLEYDDIIMSGTPKGVDNFKKGDIFEAKLYEKERLLIEHTWTAE